MRALGCSTAAWACAAAFSAALGGPPGLGAAAFVPAVRHSPPPGCTRAAARAPALAGKKGGDAEAESESGKKDGGILGWAFQVRQRAQRGAITT